MHAQMPSSGMGLTSPSYPSRMYPDNRLFGQYGQYGNTLKGGLGFGSNVYNSRNNGRWGVVDTKYKPTLAKFKIPKLLHRKGILHAWSIISK